MKKKYFIAQTNEDQSGNLHVILIIIYIKALRSRIRNFSPFQNISFLALKKVLKNSQNDGFQ